MLKICYPKNTYMYKERKENLKETLIYKIKYPQKFLILTLKKDFNNRSILSARWKKKKALKNFFENKQIKNPIF